MTKYIITFCDMISNITDTVTIYACNASHAISKFNNTHNEDYEILNIE